MQIAESVKGRRRIVAHVGSAHTEAELGLLVDRHGFPLEIGCYEGNQAETSTIIPIIKPFQDRHDIEDMVVVADAGMLSAGNLAALEEANLRFIVGSRVTKAPLDLASHFRWHGDAFSDGQVIDTITPRTGRRSENDEAVRAEPVWDPEQHPGSWRAVWAYSAKRATHAAWTKPPWPAHGAWSASRATSPTSPPS
ncbi:hypothetical protein JOF34_000798 [Microbacterium amylolyticum]|uniref:Transposase IS4-like domain-containing protein n=1 Tax=Microbacterium amylolyticum TaxID=936337 RepID=A0ABS4ZFZ9_9MICO|nr:hypothetical protein [Microbacterium amylolyticum]